MMADRLHRHWESRLLNIDPDESGGAVEFEKLVARVRRDYAALVDELNRVFVRLAEASHFEIGGVQPQESYLCRSRCAST